MNHHEYRLTSQLLFILRDYTVKFTLLGGYSPFIHNKEHYIFSVHIEICKYLWQSVTWFCI